MFIVRSACLNDFDDLYQLSSLMSFINLPHNKIELEELLIQSEKSFSKPSEHREENSFIFVLEDCEKNKVLGSSVIHAQHGCPSEPHYFLKVGKEEKFCQSLNTGFIHGTLKLGIDTTGYTEIGGLVVHPDLRSHPEKLGKQISFARFLYMSTRQELFCKKTHSELMPPFDLEGKSPLWEAIGRRFLNMDYYDADKLSRKNPEFILSLFPSSNIYQTLLPVEARESVGKVGRKTVPVRSMLEKIGFIYTHEVDPFDGGPHYRCLTKNIKPIAERKILPLIIHQGNFDHTNKPKPYLFEFSSEKYQFWACKLLVLVGEEGITIQENDAKRLKLQGGQTLKGIPLSS